MRNERRLFDIRFVLFITVAVMTVAAHYLYARSLMEETGLTFGIFDAGSGKWLSGEYYSFDYLKKLLLTRFFA